MHGEVVCGVSYRRASSKNGVERAGRKPAGQADSSQQGGGGTTGTLYSGEVAPQWGSGTTMAPQWGGGTTGTS